VRSPGYSLGRAAANPSPARTFFGTLYGVKVVAAIGRLLRHANPFVFIPALWPLRNLVAQLTWREVTGRYRSSVLGLFWSFVTPLVTLALYTFVFGIVFRARWPGSITGNLAEFGLMLFAGLTAFAVFNECLTRSPTLVASSPNYVKKVVFPLEVLAVSVLGAALFHAVISVLILTVARQLVLGSMSWTVVFVPVVLLPMVLLSLGLSWLLASLGVFFRDLAHTVTLVSQALLLTTPIFYAADVVPEPFRTLVNYNPLTPIVENMRRVSVTGVPPDWQGLAVSTIIGVLVLCAGHAWFAVTKPAFADVI
jgi:lipopolysaccharide transport system permease protein